jgi:hypothetical protein
VNTPFPEEDLDEALLELVTRRQQEDRDQDEQRLEEHQQRLDEHARGEDIVAPAEESVLAAFQAPEERLAREANPMTARLGLLSTGRQYNRTSRLAEQRQRERDEEHERQVRAWRDTHAYLEHAEVQLLHRGDPQERPIPIAPVFLRARRLAVLPPLRQAPERLGYTPYRRPSVTLPDAHHHHASPHAGPYRAPWLRASLALHETLAHAVAT